MGCGSISKQEQSVWLNAFSGLYRYRVKVFVDENKSTLEFIHEDQFDEMPLTTLMNIISFSEKDLAQIDANFISIYDKVNDKFEYFIERLVGIQRNTEKEWVLYINKNKHTWNQICQNNLKVHPRDTLIWIFQSPNEIKM